MKYVIEKLKKEQDWIIRVSNTIYERKDKEHLHQEYLAISKVIKILEGR